MKERTLTYKEVEKYAYQFAVSQGINEKKTIIRTVFLHSRMDGLTTFARLVMHILPDEARRGTHQAIEYLKWLGDIDRWKKQRNRARRKRKPLPSTVQEQQYIKESKIEAVRNSGLKLSKPLSNPKSKAPGSFESSFR
ncbi:hypothetical protein [Desulfofundulus thermosubterraneus]|uniref:hypothetical protein n=1 Tax=Desulfofundulus thermosubterraneus TaxID=348840 RepID=UPI0009324F30|nr:hypothetical protein [Desulfofundulus thermosubterraneus]